MMQHDNLDLDHDRQQRCGFPEVVYGAGKSPEEIVAALTSIADRSQIALATRVDDQVGADIAHQIDDAQWHHRCRCISIDRENRPRLGQVTIICAGSSDLPVAQEAQVTADLAGASTEVIPDGDCSPHQRRLWRGLWRSHGSPRDAMLLRSRHLRGQHR